MPKKTRKKAATIKRDNPLNYFTLQEKLGEGSYGSVYKAIRKSDGLVVAIKQVPVDEDIDDLRQEIEVMKDCNSDFITAYEGTYFNDKKEEIWIVMEYCAAGSIADIMCALDRPLDEEQIAVVCKFTLKGLQYLHQKMKKIHRDIKGGNILLNQFGRAKLADFGVAGHLADVSAKRMTVIGTPFWMAPEVVREVGYDFKADIWSLGITAIEMAEMDPPNSDMHPMRAIFLIPTRPPPTLSDPDEWSEDFNDFLSCCLVKDPEERWSADELLQHPFIKGARGPGYLQPLVDEVLELFANGNRAEALQFNTVNNTSEKEEDSYISSGDESFNASDTLRRIPDSDEDEEDEEDEDDFSGTMRRDTNATKKHNTPAFIKHMQNKKEKREDYSVLSVEELNELKRNLIAEKSQKIQKIREKYKKLQLPE